MTEGAQLAAGYSGHATLERVEHASRYNAWIASRLRPHLGRRVIEVGAGMGTITKLIRPWVDTVFALEPDQAYSSSLKRHFLEKGDEGVRVFRRSVEETDWGTLRLQNINTVVASNVLEHIEDDAAAVGSFRRALKVGGGLVLLVPALPKLFCALDEQMGHHRRYSPERIRSLFDFGGFELERLEWMNVAGIPGWWLNGKRGVRDIPAWQVRVFDCLTPLFAALERAIRPRVGLSLIAVGRAK